MTDKSKDDNKEQVIELAQLFLRSYTWDQIYKLGQKENIAYFNSEQTYWDLKLNMQSLANAAVLVARKFVKGDLEAFFSKNPVNKKLIEHFGGFRGKYFMMTKKGEFTKAPAPIKKYDKPDDHAKVEDRTMLFQRLYGEKRTLFRLGKSYGAPFFETIFTPQDYTDICFNDVDAQSNSYLAIAAAIRDGDIPAILEKYKPDFPEKPLVNFRGRLYTFTGEKVENRSEWETIKETVRKLIEENGAPAYLYLRALRNFGGEAAMEHILDEMRNIAKKEVDPGSAVDIFKEAGITFEAGTAIHPTRKIPVEILTPIDDVLKSLQDIYEPRTMEQMASSITKEEVIEPVHTAATKILDEILLLENPADIEEKIGGLSHEGFTDLVRAILLKMNVDNLSDPQNEHDVGYTFKGNYKDRFGIVRDLYVTEKRYPLSDTLGMDKVWAINGVAHAMSSKMLITTAQFEQGVKTQAEKLKVVAWDLQDIVTAVMRLG